MPRGLPWSDFPIYSKPYNRVDKRKATDLVATLRDHEHHVVCNGSRAVTWQDRPMSAGMRAWHRLECGELLALTRDEDCRAGKPVSKVHLTDGQGRMVDTDVDDLRHDALCDASFHYSYKVNALAILGRALREAVKVPSAPCPVSEVMLPWDGLYFLGRESEENKSIHTVHLGDKIELPDITLCSPYLVQMLHALRNAGQTDISHMLSAETYEAGSDDEGSWTDGVTYRLDFQDGGLVRARGLSVVAVRRGRVAWTGNGKHEPVVMSGNGREEPNWSMPGRAWASMDADILSCGLATADVANGTLCISPRGERFLDLLHPDCMDPDIMCRWRAGGQLILPWFHAEAEAWMHRFFRKAKVAVNRRCAA